MKMVYEAAHSVEAHMIADLLRQEGIAGMVQGEYLQGAVGGLPASGLVRVVVDEADYERARRVIEHWSAAQADEPVAPRRSATPAQHWPWFAAGLLAGAALTWMAAPGSGPAAEPPLCRS